MNVKTCLALYCLIISGLLPACDKPLLPAKPQTISLPAPKVWNVELPAKPDEEIVQAYLKSLPVSATTIDTKTTEDSGPVKHTLAWLLQSLYEHSAPENQHYIFKLYKQPSSLAANPKSELAKKMARHSAESHEWVLIIYGPEPELLACPEHLALVNPKNLHIVAKWAEGG